MKCFWLILGLIGLHTAAASAATYYINTEHPAAADTNPGTAEEPWKTIGHAAATLQAGDTAKIRPGRYREGNIRIANSGKRLPHDPLPPQSNRLQGGVDGIRIVFEAEGTEPIIVDGSIEIATDAWQPAEGRTNVYVAPVPADTLAGHPILWVYLNGRLLDPCIKEVGVTAADGTLSYKKTRLVPEEGDAGLWHWDAEKQLLYVNFGGQGPAKAGRVEAAVYPFAFHGGFNEFLTLRGLTIQRFNGRTIDFTRVNGAEIEDCLLRHCGSAAITSGTQALVRRNTVIDANGVGIMPQSDSDVIENLVLRNYRNRLTDASGYHNTAISFFGQDSIHLENNVVLESPANGIWPDCRSNGHVFYGNTVGYCRAYGFYIECPAFQNVLLNNVVFETGAPGIALMANLFNVVSENYVFRCRTGVGFGHTQNALMRNNVIVGNWFRDMPTGLSAGKGQRDSDVLKHLADRNVYDPSVKSAAFWGGTLYKTLDEFRAATGNEMHGRAEAVNEDELGLVSFRVAEGARPWEPALMFGNPHCSGERSAWGRQCGASTPYFWFQGTAESDQARWYFASGDGLIAVGEPGGGARTSDGRRGYMVAATPEEEEAIRQRQLARGLVDAAVLEVGSTEYLPPYMKNSIFWKMTEQAISERGLGYYSASLPTAPGTIVDLRLHVQAREIEPVAPGGGLVVFAEWSDDTRRRVERQYLVGRDEAGMNHHPEKMGGTYAYQPIVGEVTAPEWARRFRLFFGLRSCTGAALFDDLDTIRARPGKEGVVVETQPPEAQPQPLVNAGTLDFHIVDLSKVVNRELADEKADDGVGGWSDQGAGCDMAGLQPGRKQYQGVPFEILKEPHNIVVLGTPWRPKSKLPKQVTIAVERSAEVLYFLHDSAYTAENQENFRYVIRYADGTQEAIPIVGGTHIIDWATGSQARFTRKTPGMRPSVAEMVGGGLVFPQVNVYMLEWLNSHPEKEIAAIDFVSAGKGVPILLGITTGTRKP